MKNMVDRPLSINKESLCSLLKGLIKRADNFLLPMFDVRIIKKESLIFYFMRTVFGFIGIVIGILRLNSLARFYYNTSH